MRGSARLNLGLPAMAIGWLLATSILAPDTLAQDPPEGGSIVLPAPPAKFDGTIGRTYKNSNQGHFPGARRIPESSSPNIKNRTHTITAEVVILDGGADGVLVAAGGIVGGYSFYIKEGKPAYEYNRFTQDRYRVVSGEKIAPGPHALRVAFRYDGGGLGKGGEVVLLVNDKEVARGRVDKTIASRFPAEETFDTGVDTGSPASDAYTDEFPFAGTIRRVVVNIKPEKLEAADLDRLRRSEAARRIAE